MTYHERGSHWFRDWRIVGLCPIRGSWRDDAVHPWFAHRSIGGGGGYDFRVPNSKPGGGPVARRFGDSPPRLASPPAYVEGNLGSSSGERYSEQVLKVGWPSRSVRGFIRTAGGKVDREGARLVGRADQPVRLLPTQPLWPGVALYGFLGNGGFRLAQDPTRRSPCVRGRRLTSDCCSRGRHHARALRLAVHILVAQQNRRDVRAHRYSRSNEHEQTTHAWSGGPRGGGHPGGGLAGPSR